MLPLGGEVRLPQCETVSETLRHTILLRNPQDPECLMAGQLSGKSRPSCGCSGLLPWRRSLSHLLSRGEEDSKRVPASRACVSQERHFSGGGASLHQSLPCTRSRPHIWRHPGCPLKPGSAPPSLSDSPLQGPPPVCSRAPAHPSSLRALGSPSSVGLSVPRTDCEPLSAPPAPGARPRAEGPH